MDNGRTQLIMYLRFAVLRSHVIGFAPQTSLSSAHGRPSTIWSFTSWHNTASSKARHTPSPSMPTMCSKPTASVLAMGSNPTKTLSCNYRFIQIYIKTATFIKIEKSNEKKCTKKYILFFFSGFNFSFSAGYCSNSTSAHW